MIMVKEHLCIQAAQVGRSALLLNGCDLGQVASPVCVCLLTCKVKIIKMPTLKGVQNEDNNNICFLGL